MKQLWTILKYFFQDRDSLLLHLMEMKAYELLNDCGMIEVGATEEIEDLIFHIKSYYDIPENIVNTKYPDLKGMDVKYVLREFNNGNLHADDILRFADFFVDVEKQRAVERDIIFDHAKALSFGFYL